MHQKLRTKYATVNVHLSDIAYRTIDEYRIGEKRTDEDVGMNKDEREKINVRGGRWSVHDGS